MPPRELTVTLGGREFTVPQRTIRADAEWRRSVREIVDPISELTMAAGVDKPSPERMVRLAFGSSLLIEPDTVLNALLRYSPVLEEQAEWIGEHAYSDEALMGLLTLFFGMTPTPRATTPNGAAPKPPQTT